MLLDIQIPALIQRKTRSTWLDEGTVFSTQAYMNERSHLVFFWNELPQDCVTTTF